MPPSRSAQTAYARPSPDKSTRECRGEAAAQVGSSTVTFMTFQPRVTNGPTATTRRPGFIPTNDGTCVFVGTTPARIRSLRRNGVEHAFNALVASAGPALVDRVAEATPADRMHGWSGAVGYLRRCWGPGWALVGDAGYFKDPITTHGMTDALRDAELLADAVLAMFSGSEEASVMGEYEHTRDRLSGEMFSVTEAIAAYDWNLAGVRHLLREVSAAMGDEVDHLQALPPRPGVPTA